ncbi:hypothetical protein Sste5346_009546 [Sporothrix stenoceras]|uniref:Xylanolytic transcriptional activator regulatory domain-containing protein n=1 Tax=Sporothrix stenoceras TaxID=5173 RepID=A0ABR3YJD3_9PEZI
MDYPVVFHMVSDSKAFGYIDNHAEVDRIEALVTPFGPRLVRLYWLLVQPSFPLLCPARFMRDYAGASSYRAIHAPLLGAIYLQALTWWTYDSELSLWPLPDVGKLRRLTLDAIQMAFHRPRLASIQAMLVYLHCRPEAPLTADHTFARGLTSQMLAVAEAMGLHTDSSDWTIPTWERAERKRLAWALYMQDKWTALAYGRPSHIVDDNWDVQDLVSADFEEDEGVELGSVEEMLRRGRSDEEREKRHANGPGAARTNTSGASTSPAEGDVSVPSAPGPSGRIFFSLLLSLTKILSRVLSAFFTIRTSRDQDTARLLETATPFLTELAAWRTQLATALPVTPQRPRHLCPVGSIHFCYYGVVINLFRRLVRSTALAPLCSDPAVLSSIRQQAIQAAHEATHFVTSLRLDQLEAFWYFPSPYMFALVGSFHTLLLVTALSRTERDYWRETLSGFLWSLRIMSKASDPMRYAVNRLEGGVLRGLEHALVVNVDHPPSSLTTRGPNGSAGLVVDRHDLRGNGPQDTIVSRRQQELPSGATLPTAVDLEQLLLQLDSTAEFAYTDYSGFGLQSFDWLSMQMQNQDHDHGTGRGPVL